MMTANVLSAPLVALLGLAGVPVAFSQTDPERRPREPATQPSSADHEKLKQYLARHPESDADKNGVLTLAEFRNHRGQRARRSDPANAERRLAPTHQDVAYGEHPKQAFDIWLPESESRHPSPLVIYIHGGGFRGGDKRSVSPRTIRFYLDRGIAFASMNYRLTEGGKFPYPAAMHDAARGLQFIRSKAKAWILDKSKVACYGGSAGAGISMWLAFHDDLAKSGAEDPVARESTRIVAAGSTNGQSTYDMRTFRQWFGVPDLKPHEALYPFYGIDSDDELESRRVEDLMQDASPISHLGAGDVPVYLSYGRGDVPVDAKTNQGIWVHHVRLGLKLQEAMKKLGIECVVTSPDHKDARYKDLHTFLAEKIKR